MTNRRVAASGAFDLARLISSLNSPSLRDRDRYEMLLSVLESLSLVDDYDDLALLT